MLHIIGVGLNDYLDLSLRSVEILKSCDYVYHENYTCILNNIFDIQKIIDKNIIMVNRSLVEDSYKIIENSIDKNVAFLVSGSPFFATTHTDLLLRAKEKNVKVNVIHNVSISSVMGCYGLYSYNFGRTISIPYFTKSWKPMSFYDRILLNFNQDLHTLCLLDIKTDENRFMSANDAISQLLECENALKKNLIKNKLKIFVICRFSTTEEKVYYDEIDNLLKMDFGKPLHSLIIPSKLSIIEKEFIEKMFNK